MFVQVLFFLLLSSGSVFCAALWNRKYEEILPITCMSFILILFLLGLFNILSAGVYIIAIISIGLYLFSIIWILKKRKMAEFLKSFFTLAFWGFIAIFILLTFLNKGKLVSSCDEFTHWADIVKVMTTLNDFGTNPHSHSFFKSYPPAMALFQYLLQKLVLLLNPSSSFNEWRLYFSYQILALSFLLPFVSIFKYKKPILTIFTALAVCIAPMIFYPELFTQLLIDPFLGIVTGAALSMVFVWPKRDTFYYANIFLSTSTLVLTKDSGLLFACFVLFAFIAKELYFRNFRRVPGTDKFKIPVGLFIIGICSIVLPKLLWSLDIEVNHASGAHQLNVRFSDILNAVIYHDPPSRIKVMRIFIQAFITRGLYLIDSSFVIPYPALLISLFVSLFFISYAYRKIHCGNSFYKTFVGITACMALFYTIGLCILYMFYFSEYEAVRVGGFERYLNAMFLALFLTCFISLASLAPNYPARKNKMVVLLIAVVFMFSPWTQIVTFTCKDPILVSETVRLPYDNFSNKTKEIIGNRQAKIYVVSQATTGLDYYILHYTLRPYELNSGAWSIGVPFYEGDVWTITMTSGAWAEKIFSEYDYIALYQINDYFVENFSSLFQNASEISADSIYFVNRQTHLLEKCG